MYYYLYVLKPTSIPFTILRIVIASSDNISYTSIYPKNIIYRVPIVVEPLKLNFNL